MTCFFEILNPCTILSKRSAYAISKFWLYLNAIAMQFVNNFIHFKLIISKLY